MHFISFNKAKEIPDEFVWDEPKSPQGILEKYRHLREVLFLDLHKDSKCFSPVYETEEETVFRALLTGNYLSAIGWAFSPSAARTLPALAGR